MINHRIILFIIVVLFFEGCKPTEKNDSLTIIKVPETARDKEIGLHEVIDTLFYLPLETKDECILNVDMLRRMEYYKGRYYLFIYTQGLFIFNSDGKYYNSIPFGRAPGELNMRNSHKAFFVDKENDRLVFPGWHVLHYYDLDGKFISTLNLKAKIVPPQVAIENGDYWFYFFGSAPFNKKNDAFHFYRYDLEDGVQEGYLQAHSLNKYGEGGFGYGEGDGILAYSPLTSDTIFRIKDGQCAPAFYIDFGEKRFPSGLSPELHYDFSERKRNYTGAINEVVTNGKILYFTYCRDNVKQDAYYFIDSGKIFTGAINDKNKLYIPVGHTLNYAEGYFIAVANACFMVSWTPQLSEKLGLQEDDNPVLVLYRFKSNIK